MLTKYLPNFTCAPKQQQQPQPSKPREVSASGGRETTLVLIRMRSRACLVRAADHERCTFGVAERRSRSSNEQRATGKGRCQLRATQVQSAERGRSDVR